MGMGLPMVLRRSSASVRRNLADEVAARLYDAVVRGVLRPGEKVVEAALSRQMDVSRAPIREGIRVLVERGLLIQIPRRGVFVREYGMREIEEVNELRLAIETGALSRTLAGGYMLELDVLQNAFDGRSPPDKPETRLGAGPRVRHPPRHCAALS